MHNGNENYFRGGLADISAKTKSLMTGLICIVLSIPGSIAFKAVTRKQCFCFQNKIICFFGVLLTRNHNFTDNENKYFFGVTLPKFLLKQGSAKGDTSVTLPCKSSNFIIQKTHWQGQSIPETSNLILKPKAVRRGRQRYGRIQFQKQGPADLCQMGAPLPTKTR